jgi:hypothetical protein
MNNSHQEPSTSAMTLATILALGFTFAWFIIVMVLSVASATDPPSPGHHGWGWFVLCILPSPALSAIELLLLTPLAPNNGNWFSNYTQAFARLTPDYWLPLIAVSVASVFLAIWCYRRHQRLSQRDAAAWATFVFVMGLPGLVGYLLLCRWPASERCQHCGKTSPRDRDACLHCGTPFPPPAPKGIEIFA